ncbi:MAG: hypothetical protein ACX93U_01190 [Salipiger thiooxidans]|jgi:hypothetical protein|uniref:hypothetical protein n=1 Tax=Salipiger thiooxidans TaxID=282683 RepID=UPI001CFBC5DC|nr:hypothetical protein [Salipiger thiooxidans]MBR9838377.1 hypothetical protein [Paracoccaceae bacterium]
MTRSPEDLKGTPPRDSFAAADLRKLDRTAILVFAVLLVLGALVGVDAVSTTRDSLDSPIEAQAIELH